MSAPQFTPGPWQVDHDRDFDEYRIVATGEFPEVVFLLDDCEADHDENTPANAHLIAAAPDLYDALRALLGHAESAGFVPTDIRDAARGAIKQARGEA